MGNKQTTPTNTKKTVQDLVSSKSDKYFATDLPKPPLYPPFSPPNLFTLEEKEIIANQQTSNTQQLKDQQKRQKKKKLFAAKENVLYVQGKPRCIMIDRPNPGEGYHLDAAYSSGQAYCYTRPK